MGVLKETLDQGACGIFVSPTGTGKSISIICSALHWLRTNRGKRLSEHGDASTQVSNECVDDNEPDWVRSFGMKKKSEELEWLEAKQRERHRRVERDRREGYTRLARNKKQPSKKRYQKGKKRARSEASDDEFAPDDELELGDGTLSCGSTSSVESEGDEDLIDDTATKIRKIFFCSRTHSQLSQFMNEVARTKFSKDISSVALGSRKQLCANVKVRSRSTAGSANDGCLDLFEKAKSSRKKSTAVKRVIHEGQSRSLPKRSLCPFYDKSGISRLKDHILYEAQDIETVATMGEA